MMILILAILVSLFLMLRVDNPFSPRVFDSQMRATRALPASISAVVSSAMDTGARTSMGLEPPVEFLLTAPALSTAQLPDTKIMSYDIIGSANADLSSSTTVAPGVLVQTGAGGAGAAGATKRIRAASDWPRFLGFQINPSASGTGDASATTATLDAAF
jgi:hypothetical protein